MNFTLYVKKKIIGKEVSFETSKKQVKFNETHTHVITLSSAMSPEKKLYGQALFVKGKRNFFVDHFSP